MAYGGINRGHVTFGGNFAKYVSETKYVKRNNVLYETILAWRSRDRSFEK